MLLPAIARRAAAHALAPATRSTLTAPPRATANLASQRLDNIARAMSSSRSNGADSAYRQNPVDLQFWPDRRFHLCVRFFGRVAIFPIMQPASRSQTPSLRWTVGSFTTAHLSTRADDYRAGDEMTRISESSSTSDQLPELSQQY